MDEKKDIGYIPQEWSQKPGNSVGNENGNQNNGSADNEMRSGLMNNGEENSLRTDCGHPEYSTPGLSEKSPSGCENAYETKNNGNIPQPQEDPQKSEKLKNWLKDEIGSTKEELTNIQRQFEDGITELKDGLQSVKGDLNTCFKTQKDALSGIFEEKIGQLKSDINSKLETHVKDKLDVGFQSVKQDFETVKTVVTELKNEVQRVKEDLTNVQKSVVEAVKKDFETQNETFKQFGESINALKNSIENQQRELKDKYVQENNSLKKEITRAKDEINKKKTEIDNLKEELKTEKQKGQENQQTINNLNEELKTEKQNGKKEIDDLTVKLEHYTSLEIHELEDAYNEFKNLNTKTKSTIGALFPQPSFIGFISAGMRLSNISSLWEMAKRNIFNNNLEDIEKLNKIFRILITVYNRGLKERQFELICPEIGSKYDSSTSAIKEMKSSGTVKEVLLIGYKNTADQNVHKAIISVNE